MQEILNLVVYNNLAKEIKVKHTVLEKTGLSNSEILEVIHQWVSNKDFTIIGLYAKAPRYISGIEKYQEFYLSITPEGEYSRLAVREDFTDIKKPRMLQIPVQVVDNINNQLYLGGDFTGEVYSGITHTILDASNSFTPIAQVTPIVSNYISGSDVTIITYENSDFSIVSQGDVLYFQNGENLVGIDHEIKWYDNNGDVQITKTYYSRFEAGEASIHEYNRRQTTVNQMISSSDGTAIQPFVKAVYEHYKYPYIDNYVNLSQAKEWGLAIDNETDTQINTYLDIVIPFTDIEGVTTYKMIRQWIKDELYMGYK